MPQMSPMYWMILFIMFLLYFIMVMSFIYYMKIKKSVKKMPLSYCWLYSKWRMYW